MLCIAKWLGDWKILSPIYLVILHHLGFYFHFTEMGFGDEGCTVVMVCVCVCAHCHMHVLGDRGAIVDCGKVYVDAICSLWNDT